MDDYVGGAGDKEEDIKLTGEIIQIHKEGEFTICNSISTSNKVMASIDSDLLWEEQKNFDYLDNFSEGIFEFEPNFMFWMENVNQPKETL